MYEAFAAEFGHVLCEARQRQGLRRDDVAQALGLSVPVYARMERGKLLPSIIVLRELALLLNVSTEALLRCAGRRAATDAGARDEVYALLRSLLLRLKELPDEEVRALARELRAGLSTLDAS